MLRLAKAPKKIHNYIEKGKISETAVIAVLKAEDAPESQLNLVEEAVTNAKAQGQLLGREKKATAKHITSNVKMKSSMQILAELGEALDENSLMNDKTALFHSLMTAVKAKKKVSELVKLFH